MSRQATGTVERALQSLERRITGALDARDDDWSQAVGKSHFRAQGERKVTDPELLKRRRQALAKEGKRSTVSPRRRFLL